MSAALPTKRVRYMDAQVWDAIRVWGKDKGLEMADAIALLWELQRERESLGEGGRATGMGAGAGGQTDKGRLAASGRMNGYGHEQSGTAADTQRTGANEHDSPR